MNALTVAFTKVKQTCFHSAVRIKWPAKMQALSLIFPTFIAANATITIHHDHSDCCLLYTAAHSSYHLG